MSTTPNPATPPQSGATPGSSSADAPKPSAASQTPTIQAGQEGQQEGKVVISTEEYRNLQRDKARLESFRKRSEFSKRKAGQSFKPIEEGGNDPELVGELHKYQEKNANLERELVKIQIKDKVRDILNKPEYLNLPQSTKNLILKNPSALSNAEDVEEAIMDIEDFIREATIDETPANQKLPASGKELVSPHGHETPQNVSASAPAPAGAMELEDTSRLTGHARSRAVLRNSIKQKKLGMIK